MTTDGQLIDVNTTARSAWRPARRAHVIVSGLKRQNEELGRFPANYVLAIRRSGGRAVAAAPFELDPEDAVPPDVEVATGLDPDDVSILEDAHGLLLPGGGDIDPGIYGQTLHPRTYNICALRDRFELNLLHEALGRDMPVLAICRGMQLLNVGLGGTLEQHLSDVPGRLPHDRDRPRPEPAHELRLSDEAVLTDVLGGPRSAVNSHHHQALDRVADPLEEIGWAEDGVLEAVASSDHSCVIGVQWHPEVMAPINDRQAALFGYFLEAVNDYSERVVGRATA